MVAHFFHVLFFMFLPKQNLCMQQGDCTRQTVSVQYLYEGIGFGVRVGVHRRTDSQLGMPQQPLNRLFFPGSHRQIIKFASSADDLQQSLQLRLRCQGGLEKINSVVGQVVVAADHGAVEGFQLVCVLIYGDDLGGLQF